MRQEWGRWITHDGKSMPVQLGVIVQREFDIDPDSDCPSHIGPVTLLERDNWLWVSDEEVSYRICRIIRYRILKSRAFQMLERLADLPSKISRGENA